jgi:hypothetical protein
MRPWPIAEQHSRLCRMLEWHFAYFGNANCNGRHAVSD